jgi:uncharacterized short protein YbdD (DUF466 family)
MPIETRLNRLVQIVRRVLGMPDYQEYLRHLERRQASGSVPSEREFFESYLRSRYGRGPSRCC